ncbi:MAG: terminase [Bacillota bacterium]|nr:terminase [Bacillota bacterium]
MISVWTLSGNKSVNITPLLKSIEWSGDKSQASRKLGLSVAYSIFDKNQVFIQITPGSLIWAMEDGNEFFRGVVFSRELSSSGQELKITAYDYLIYFLKSKASFNFSNALPEDIAVKICQEVGVGAGSILKTGTRIDLIVQAQSLYDVIMKAYTKVSQINGRQYMALMKGTALNIIEKGSTVVDYTLKPEENVIDTSYTESIENMVNKVKIYDDKGNYTGKLVSNDGWVKLYGVLQEAYTIEEGKNPTVVAENMMHGLDICTDIEVLGNRACISGYALNTNIWYIDSLKNSKWYIDSDSHTWDIGTGKHTMKLTLYQQNEMDAKED